MSKRLCKIFAQTMDDRENAMAEQTPTTDGICANSGSKKSEINISKSRIRRTKPREPVNSEWLMYILA